MTGDLEHQALETLGRLGRPTSGRGVAAAMGVSPSTAIKTLTALGDKALVTATQRGRATLWSLTEDRPGRRRTGGERERRHAVVFTAIQEEFLAVTRKLGETQRRKTTTGTRYAQGTIQGESIEWQISVAQIGMGNPRAATEVTTAAVELAPDILLMVGIGGGLKPSDETLGDVVIASRIYDLDAGKEATAPNGEVVFYSRPGGSQTSPRLVQLAYEVAREGQALPRNSGRVVVAPIVATNAVIGSSLSPKARLMRERFNDARAVDMESLGVYEAAFAREIPVLSVRGISDFLDKTPEGDRKSHPIASSNAASVAIALLVSADTDDVPTKASVDPKNRGIARDSEPAGQEASAQLRRLPPGVATWWRLAEKGPCDTASLQHLIELGTNPRSWLTRLKHRQPEWLRHDKTGVLFALVAEFADAHGHDIGHRLWADAASRLERDGNDELASWCRIAGTLSQLNSSAQGQLPAPEAATLARTALADEESGPLAPVAAFLNAAIAVDPASGIHAELTDAELDLGTEALRWLGLTDPYASSGAVVLVNFELADDGARRLEPITANVVLALGSVLARLLLAKDQFDRAIALLNTLALLSPTASAPRLLIARAALQRLSTPGEQWSRTTETLRWVEQEALIVRDHRRDWGERTAEPLALAAHARLLQGDAKGALSLTLPSPRGRALEQESRSPDVSYITAQAALMLNEAELAIDAAQRLLNNPEREIVRGTAFAHSAGMSSEAVTAFESALNHPDVTPEQRVRAILGLNRANPDRKDITARINLEIESLRKLDQEAADLTAATIALDSKNAEVAFALARRYKDSLPAVQIAAQAAASLGDVEEAISMLDRAGVERGDDTLCVEALALAMDSGKLDEANAISARLALSNNSQIRMTALHARLDIAGNRETWHDVVDLCQRLLTDAQFDLSDSQRAAHCEEYRWRLARALYHLRRGDEALRSLEQPSRLQPRNPNEARFVIACLHLGDAGPAPEQVDRDLRTRRTEWVVDIASTWLEDEAVLASALSYLLMFGKGEGLDQDKLVIRVRALQEEFFSRFPDSSLLRRVDVGDNLAGLVTFLKEQFDSVGDERSALLRRISLGHYPLSFVGDVGRGYAHALITNALGYLVAASPFDDRREAGRSAARAALTSRRVAVDLSVLSTLPEILDAEVSLIAPFAKLFLSADQRDDLLAARAALATSGGSTIGWNSKLQIPTLDEPSEIQLNQWLVKAKKMVETLALLDAVRPLNSSNSGIGEDDGFGDLSWDGSIRLAKQLNLPLWADDLALRTAAQSEGVLSFGTVDLLDELLNSARLKSTDHSTALLALAQHPVVDLPVEYQYPPGLVDSDRRYSALLLSRPAHWTPIHIGLKSFFSIMRGLPDDFAEAERLSLVMASCVGAAWSVPPPARSSVVATLLTWETLNESQENLPALVEIGETVLGEAAPGSDFLKEFVSHLKTTLAGVADQELAAVFFARLVAPLDEQRRGTALRHFLE